MHPLKYSHCVSKYNNSFLTLPLSITLPKQIQINCSFLFVTIMISYGAILGKADSFILIYMGIK